MSPMPGSVTWTTGAPASNSASMTGSTTSVAARTPARSPRDALQGPSRQALMSGGWSPASAAR